MDEQFNYQSPLGNLLIQIQDQQITAISFSDKAVAASVIDGNLKTNIIQQLDDYFAGKKTNFDLPLNPKGTDFQKKVWTKLTEIPFGTTITYLELAVRLGDKKLIRAVGGANSKNPIAIVIPCHRVIGANQKLVGYAGGIHRKKWLLKHELSFAPIKKTLF